jgi:hypothetical protein
MSPEEQRRANKRMGLLLAGIAILFFVVAIAKQVWPG